MGYIFQNKPQQQGIVCSVGRGVAITDNRSHIYLQKKQIQAIQRTKLKSGCLNVAGEVHSDYDIPMQPSRRYREAEYAEEFGLKYYEEADYKYPAGWFRQTEKFGDDYILKLVQCIKVADVNINAIYDLMPQKLNEAEKYYNEFKNRMKTSKYIIERMIYSDYKGYRKILESLKSAGLYSKDVYSYSDDLKNDYKTIESKAKEKIALFKNVFTASEINMDIYELTFRRSMNMHESAKQNKKEKVLWKVGDAHIGQIEAIHTQVGYNILSKEEFNKDFIEWNNNKDYSQL